MQHTTDFDSNFNIQPTYMATYSTLAFFLSPVDFSKGRFSFVLIVYFLSEYFGLIFAKQIPSFKAIHRITHRAPAPCLERLVIHRSNSALFFSVVNKPWFPKNCCAWSTVCGLPGFCAHRALIVSWIYFRIKMINRPTMTRAAFNNFF